VAFTDRAEQDIYRAHRASKRALFHGEDAHVGQNMPLEEEKFVQFMQGLSADQLQTYGPVLADKWLRKCDRVYRVAEGYEEETGIEDLSADFCIVKPSEHDLEQVDWETELVRALLVDVDEEAEPMMPKLRTEAFRIDADTAMKMYKGIGLSTATEEHGEVANGGSRVEDMMEDLCLGSVDLT
jgi:hypothetical protein